MSGPWSAEAVRRSAAQVPACRVARAVALAGLAAFAAGCVDRLLQIRSDPPGADVYINGVRAGKTPLDQPFDFYGTFDITLRSPDRLSVRHIEPVRPPWWELPPFDFVVENLSPFRIRDSHELSYALEALPEAPRASDDRKAVRDRMQALEAKAEAPAEPVR